jgi:hypothetical protein
VFTGTLTGMSLRGQRGQASVELVAVLPLVAVLAGALWQVAIAGQAAWLTGAAARAAARASALGADPAAAARRVLPGRLRRTLHVRTARDGSVVVRVGVPLAFGAGRLATLEQRARFASQSP